MKWIEKEINISDVKELLKQGYEIEVDSADGFVPVTDFVDKGIYEEYVLEVEDGTIVLSNENHLYETTTGWEYAKDLVNKQSIFLTRNGHQSGSVRKTDNKIPIVDITVNHSNHRYYTEGVSSHNTGIGKSLFMCHMAANCLAENRNVLYITLEMAEERIAERIDANLMNVALDTLKELSRDVYNKKVDKLKKKIKGKLIIKEYPTATASVNNFRALMNELKIKRGFIPDILFMDYLNLCVSTRYRNNISAGSYFVVKAIAEELRGLAVEWNIPVMSATQLNRTGFMSTDVGLEDTSESFGLPATADFMFALISTEELEEHNQIKVKQLKNRYNDPVKNRNFVIGIDRAKMKLYDVEEEAQQELNTEPKEKEGKVIKKRKSGPMSWDTFKEEKRKNGLGKIVV